ncbi:MAG: anti-sigma factor antagonist [Oscillospiraceae bacterium]
MGTVEFVLNKNSLKIFISGEIDHHSAFEMKDIIDGQILNVCPKVVIINFEKVTFMDSSGIGLVLARYKFAQNCGASLYVEGVNTQTRKILALAGIKTINDITV